MYPSHQLFFKRPLFSLAVSVDRLLSRFSRAVYTRPSQMAIDAAVVAIALWVSYIVRFDGQVPTLERQQYELVVFFVAALYIINNFIWTPYDRVWRFFNLEDAYDLAGSVASATLVTLWWRFFGPTRVTNGPIPTGVLMILPLVTYAGWSGVRFTRRLVYQHVHEEQDMPAAPDATRRKNRKRVMLVGAGEAGLYLLRELRKTDYHIVGFLDDDPALQGRSIGGLRVFGTTSQLELFVQQYKIQEVILCLPSAPKSVVQQIAERCAMIPVKASSVPALWEIMSGRVLLHNLRTVSMEALLGRDKITHSHDLDELLRTYHGRRILVTGAGGSIGSELVRQLRACQPSEVILLDKDENNLYEVACEIREDFDQVTEVVADIRDRDLMSKVFARFMPEIVFHAAAYKHVPLMEHYPAEAILNNVIGTRNLAEVSNETGVQIFVMVSTDKAVNPSSIMGASKRVAEMIVQALAAGGAQTRFCCVRFGNVLGSRASVVPLFQRQIREGRNITVTHPDVCRYFMTIPEAVQLVIKAGSFGDRGAILMLDMGDPVKIVDLARNLIELSGLQPDRDVKIEFTGLRPGEKLNEELLAAGERGIRSGQHAKIFVVEALARDGAQLEGAVEQLAAAAHRRDAAAIRDCLRSMSIGYHDEAASDASTVGSRRYRTPLMPSSVAATP